jgi:hypothetical protein
MLLDGKSRAPASRRELLPITIFVCLLVGGIAIALSLHNAEVLTRTWAASAWPAAVGRIEEFTWRETGGSKSRDYPQVTYSYWVGGTKFTGRELETGPEPSRLPDRRHEPFYLSGVGLLEPGVEVPVHYNPTAPAESVLSTGFAMQHVYECAFTALLWGIVAFAVWRYRRAPTARI